MSKRDLLAAILVGGFAAIGVGCGDSESAPAGEGAQTLPGQIRESGENAAAGIEERSEEAAAAAEDLVEGDGAE